MYPACSIMASSLSVPDVISNCVCWAKGPTGPDLDEPPPHKYRANDKGWNLLQWIILPGGWSWNQSLATLELRSTLLYSRPPSHWLDKLEKIIYSSGQEIQLGDYKIGLKLLKGSRATYHTLSTICMNLRVRNKRRREEHIDKCEYREILMFFNMNGQWSPEYKRCTKSNLTMNKLVIANMVTDILPCCTSRTLQQKHYMPAALSTAEHLYVPSLF